MIVRADLSHLPAKQQDEFERATRVLMEEFEQAIALGTQPWKRNGKVLKTILFGSYARNNWVDEPARTNRPAPSLVRQLSLTPAPSLR